MTDAIVPANDDADKDCLYINRWIPPDLVMDIAKFLPLSDLLYSARLVNKMWNIVALSQAASSVFEWIQSLRHTVPGDINVLYQGRGMKTHRDFKSSRIGTYNLESDSIFSISFSAKKVPFTYCLHDIRGYSNYPAPRIERVQVYLTAGFGGSTIEDLEKFGELRLCLQFIHHPGTTAENTAISGASAWTLARKDLSQRMKIEAIWVEFGRKAEGVRLNLTSTILKMFRFELEVASRVTRNWVVLTNGMDCRLDGYRATLQIAPVKSTDTVESFQVNGLREH